MNSGLTGAQAQNQAQMVMDRNNPRRDWGPSALNVTSQGSISARHLNIHGPDDDAKSADSIFGWAQGLRVTMRAACWGKSASKFRTAGSASPQPQHRSEYRYLAVMRNVYTA